MYEYNFQERITQQVSACFINYFFFFSPKEQQKIAGRNLSEPCPWAIKNGLNLLL